MAAGCVGDGGGVERESGRQPRPHPPLQEPQRQAGGRHRDAAGTRPHIVITRATA